MKPFSKPKTKILAFLLCCSLALVATKCPEKEVPKPAPEPCAGVNFTAEFDVIDNINYPIPANDTAQYFTDTLERKSSFKVRPKMQGDYMYYIDYKNDDNPNIEIRDGKKTMSGFRGTYATNVTSETITMTISGKGNQSNCKAVYSKTFPMIDYWNNPRLLGKYHCIRNGDTATGFDLFIENYDIDEIKIINILNGYSVTLYNLDSWIGSKFFYLYRINGSTPTVKCSGNNLCGSVEVNDLKYNIVENIFLNNGNLKIITGYETTSGNIYIQTITGMKQ